MLLPVRDAAATLPAALRSVARQSEPHLECVIVDDGSADASAAVARRFAERDPRFRLLAVPRLGLVGALQRGVEACRAPWVARMDADDLMHRQRLALQLRHLEAHPDLSGAGAHVRLFPRATLGDGMRRYERWLASIDSAEAVRREAFVECPLAHPTLVVRRSVLADHGYRDAGWPEDYDLVLRLLAAGHALGVVARRLLCWRNGPGRLSRRDATYATERFTACKAAFLARGFLAGHRRYVLWGYGGTGRALRRALAAHDRTPSHVVELHPRRLGNTIHGAPVVVPGALAALGPVRVVVSVAGAGPRAEIRAALAALGLREERDFVCAA